MSTSPGVAPPLVWASRVLNEAVMGFLALVALATAIGPLVFDVSSGTERLLNLVEGMILGVFIAEFIVQFAVARDRAAWLRSPWRIVDAICIIGPLLSFLPQVSDNVRGALVFRFLRVGRAVAFGARAGALAVQKRHDSGPTLQRGPTQVTRVLPGAQVSSSESTWRELLEWARDPIPAWYHASSVSRDQARELATLPGMSELGSVPFHDVSSPPHAKGGADTTTLALWLPTVAEQGFPEVSRNRLVLHVSEHGLLTATAFPFDLPRAVSPEPLPSVGMPVRLTFSLLGLIRDRNRVVAQRHEDEIRGLDEFRVNEGGTKFLNHAFRLQREISATSGDVWRLRGIVHKLTTGKLTLPGAQIKDETFLDDLLTDIDELDREFSELKEALQSVLELHMNVASFEMNKFMKLLAVVGFLGLIPSVAGGLLGMNVAGNPWSVTLGQVAFGIAMGMAVSLYVFAIKGWLR